MTQPCAMVDLFFAIQIHECLFHISIFVSFGPVWFPQGCRPVGVFCEVCITNFLTWRCYACRGLYCGRCIFAHRGYHFLRGWVQPLPNKIIEWVPSRVCCCWQCLKKDGKKHPRMHSSHIFQICDMHALVVATHVCSSEDGNDDDIISWIKVFF